MPESNRCSENSQSDELAVERRSVMLVDKQAQRGDSLTLDAGRGRFGVDLKHHSNAKSFLGLQPLLTPAL